MYHITKLLFRINTITKETEFVFIGWKGHGKSALIESILGMDIGARRLPLTVHQCAGLPLQPGVPTLRPIHFHVNQNSRLTEPRYGTTSALLLCAIAL